MFSPLGIPVLVAALAFGAVPAAQAQADQGAAEPVRNVVLVHGAFADGSGWRGVYDDLTARGYRVTIVQNPLTSFADDVAATRRILARQVGPVILVGHSYGGTVITEAGNDPKVAGLVYVTAFAPNDGQSTGDLLAEIPAPPEFIVEPGEDGFGFISLEKFKIGFAGDATDADAAFLRDSQVPIAMASFGAAVTQAAWKTRPSWAVIATEDNAIDPRLQRLMAERAGSETVDIAASHVPFLTHPREVADLIDRAARTATSAAP